MYQAKRKRQRTGFVSPAEGAETRCRRPSKESRGGAPKLAHETGGRRLRQWRAAALVACVGLALTMAMLYARVSESLREEGRANLNVESERIGDEIRDRMSVYSTMLASGAGMFHASDSVTRTDWSDYAASLDMPRNYPGIQNLGYMERVTGEGLARVRGTGRPRPENADRHSPAARPGPAAGTLSSALCLPRDHAQPRHCRRRSLRRAGAPWHDRKQPLPTARRPCSGKVSLLGGDTRAERRPARRCCCSCPYRGAASTPAGPASATPTWRGFVFAVFRTHELMREITARPPDRHRRRTVRRRPRRRQHPVQPFGKHARWRQSDAGNDARRRCRQ